MPRVPYGHIELSEEERRTRTIIFEYIDFFENYIRKLITKELKSYYTKKWRGNYEKTHKKEPEKIPEDIWWKQGVPEDIRKYCEAKRDKEIVKGKTEEPLILNYADFSHYSKIILKKDNWKNIFSSCFKGVEDSDVKSYFKHLKEFRDPSHHHRAVSTNSIEIVKFWILKLCVNEVAKSEFEKLIVSPSLKLQFEEIDVEKENLRTIDTFLNKIELSDKRYRKIEDLYVEPKEFNEIKEKLEKERIVFIIGDPEIGKTYTSIKLLLDYYKKGYEPVYYKEIRREEQLEILNYKQERILEGKKIIYFEDPFGKIKFEDIGSIFRDFGTFIDKIKTSQSMVIITSREEMFKIFEKEKEFSEDIRQFVECLNIVKPSYDQSDLERILEKAAKVYECEWFKNGYLRKHISEHATNKLRTPLRIIEFIAASKYLNDSYTVKKELDKKSEGTRISFAREIEAMESNKILFLSLIYFDLPLERAKSYYQRLLDILKLDYLENLFEDCLQWFVGNKVEVYDTSGIKCLGFYHPAYKDGFSYALDKSRQKEIFSAVLKELVEDEDYIVRINVGETILENIDSFQEEVQSFIKKLINDKASLVRESIAYLIFENIHKFPEGLKSEVWVERSFQKVIFAEMSAELKYWQYELRRETVGPGICEDCGNYFDFLTYIDGKCLCENCDDFSTSPSLSYNPES